MQYDTLDAIPYKTFIKIVETSDLSLLSDTEFDLIILQKIWEKLINEHESKNPENKMVFNVQKEIDIVLCKHKIVLMYCEILVFDYDQEIYDKVIEIGYQLRTESSEDYYSDLEQIIREANGFVDMANRLKLQLPKEDKNIENTTIDDVMSSYSAFLGYSIGKHNEVTYNEFFSIKKQVDTKMKQLQKQTIK